MYQSTYNNNTGTGTDSTGTHSGTCEVVVLIAVLPEVLVVSESGTTCEGYRG